MDMLFIKSSPKKRVLRFIFSIFCLSLSTAQCATTIQLFDGRSLKGWSGDPQFWRVENGEIVGETTSSTPTKNNTFLIWQGGELQDFELTLEYNIRNHNSGIQYRSFPLEGQTWAVGGYQADISADQVWTGAVYGEKYKKLIAKRGEKTLLGNLGEAVKVLGLVGGPKDIISHINTNDWNTYKIIARGNQCIQMINGITTAEFSDAGEDRLKKGLIALQLHAGEAMKVRFRNIQLKNYDHEKPQQILFLAGHKSHGYNSHEHKAGCLLLARSLNESGLNITAQVSTDNEWAQEWMGYDKPDAIVMYCDGLKKHIANDHQAKIQKLCNAGIGVACLHFGVEVEPETLGSSFLQWIGGYFEAGWSVNPHWKPEFTIFPNHPISRGVQPFSIQDEWYYHMRFQPDLKNITPILSALPPLETLTSRAKDPKRGSNPSVMAEVTAGQSQVLAWAYDRPEGGRGFGFTGGHFHQNWKNDDFRKVVLNALAWTAHVEIPAEGVISRTPSDDDMEINQDYPKVVSQKK
jgi:type 1 glutamine amidotransferase